jgi:hypothetical protein
MEDEKSAIWEPGLNLVDALADGKEITGQLTVVRRTQIDLDGIMAPIGCDLGSEKTAGGAATWHVRSKKEKSDHESM